jgi:hypothetical protein
MLLSAHWQPPVCVPDDFFRTKYGIPALIGNAQRGAGILNNELYLGRLVWNKVRMIKDPDTGKRVSRPNPKADWQTVAVPDLRIVPDDLFEAARMIRTDRGSPKPQYRRGPKRLLSGLLRCGCRGAGMALKDAAASRYRRVQCSRMKEAAPARTAMPMRSPRSRPACSPTWRRICARRGSSRSTCWSRAQTPGIDPGQLPLASPKDASARSPARSSGRSIP